MVLASRQLSLPLAETQPGAFKVHEQTCASRLCWTWLCSVWSCLSVLLLSTTAELAQTTRRLAHVHSKAQVDTPGSPLERNARDAALPSCQAAQFLGRCLAGRRRLSELMAHSPRPSGWAAGTASGWSPRGASAFFAQQQGAASPVRHRAQGGSHPSHSVSAVRPLVPASSPPPRTPSAASYFAPFGGQPPTTAFPLASAAAQQLQATLSGSSGEQRPPQPRLRHSSSGYVPLSGGASRRPTLMQNHCRRYSAP